MDLKFSFTQRSIVCPLICFGEQNLITEYIVLFAHSDIKLNGTNSFVNNKIIPAWIQSNIHSIRVCHD